MKNESGTYHQSDWNGSWAEKKVVFWEDSATPFGFTHR